MLRWTAQVKSATPFYPAQLENAGRTAGKLTASFVNLWDALERHQGRGAPAVNVENVNVNRGCPSDCWKHYKGADAARECA